MKPLSLTIISDPHYYSKKNWVDGNPYQFPPKREQQYRRGSEEIIKYVFDKICRDNESDIILINGDLTNNGECTSHEEMRELLRSLKNRGKRVYVTTATHDFRSDGISYGYDKKDNKVDVPAFVRNDLYEYYYEFGMNEALSIHMPSMSYIVQLEDGYRLLALNDDKGYNHAGFTDECFEWIKEQVENAKKDNQFIIAMTHHPILPPSPLYKIIGAKDMLECGELRAKQFADMDVPCIFTGHSHIHNISLIKSEQGNVFYDVSTSSLVGFPPYYRKAAFDPDNKSIDIHSVLVDNVPNLDTDGKSLSDYIENLFLGTVSDILNSAENDFEKFTELAVGFSLKKEKAYKLKFFIQNGAKFINHLTFGKVWRYTKRKNKVTAQEIQSIKTKAVLPFVIELVANLYKGDADMSKTSVEYRVAKAFLELADNITKPFSKKLKGLGMESVSAVALPLMNKEGIKDSDAKLKY